MLQYCDHSRYHWIWLIQNNLFVDKICCGHQSNFHWLGRSYFNVTLSCKVPYFHSNFCVVTSWTAGCGLCFPATSVSGSVTCIQALWYAVWCMGGWLVLGLWAIVPLIWWIQLTHEFIYWMNSFINENLLSPYWQCLVPFWWHYST